MDFSDSILRHAGTLRVQYLRGLLTSGWEALSRRLRSAGRLPARGKASGRNAARRIHSH
jgi:hypothetical protein